MNIDQCITLSQSPLDTRYETLSIFVEDQACILTLIERMNDLQTYDISLFVVIVILVKTCIILFILNLNKIKNIKLKKDIV